MGFEGSASQENQEKGLSRKALIAKAFAVTLASISPMDNEAQAQTILDEHKVEAYHTESIDSYHEQFRDLKEQLVIANHLMNQLQQDIENDVLFTGDKIAEVRESFATLQDNIRDAHVYTLASILQEAKAGENEPESFSPEQKFELVNSMTDRVVLALADSQALLDQIEKDLNEQDI